MKGDPNALKRLQNAQTYDRLQVINMNEKNKDKIMENVAKQDDKIRATGWGSKVRAIFDDKGELSGMIRETGGEDAQTAASYLSYLEWLFEEQDRANPNSINERITQRKEVAKKYEDPEMKPYLDKI